MITSRHRFEHKQTDSRTRRAAAILKVFTQLSLLLEKHDLYRQLFSSPNQLTDTWRVPGLFQHGACEIFTILKSTLFHCVEAFCSAWIKKIKKQKKSVKWLFGLKSWNLTDFWQMYLYKDSKWQGTGLQNVWRTVIGFWASVNKICYC